MSYNPTNPNGQATSANSSPVVIASDQSAVTVSGTVTANAGTNLNTSLLALESGGNLASTATNTTGLNNTVGTAASAIPSKLVQIGGSDGTNARAVKTNSSGQLDVRPLTSSDTVTAVQATATNLKVQAESYQGGSAVASGNPLEVNLRSSTVSVATSTKQSDGSQKTQIVDGSGNVISATSNALDVNIKTNAASTGTISTNNSSTATLGANATFTGTADDVTTYSEIRVSIWASHASATDGLSIQQSSDSTNWDVTDTYTIPATTGKTFVVPRQARYIRVTYTNGGTIQTGFRLQTILNRGSSAASSQRAGDAYTNETDLVQQQSFLMGYNGTTWDRLRTTGTGVLTTSTVLTAGSAAIGSLTAGSAIIGKVGIDQTTPGTTNAVAATNLPTTVDTNSGTKSASTLRVVLATDQPQLTNKLLVTPDANSAVNVGQINGVTPLMGNGVTGTGSQRVTIASDNTAFTVNAAQSGTWTVQPGNTANSTPWLTSSVPATSGGWSTYHLASAGSTNATNIKASAGQVGGWFVYNSNAAMRKLVFHNTAGTPTAGASVFFAICIPPGAGANVEFTNGIPFSTGIAITTVTGLADSDATAVAANDLIINIWYK